MEKITTFNIDKAQAISAELAKYSAIKPMRHGRRISGELPQNSHHALPTTLENTSTAI